ncbi:MAG TPA: hypothetical protein EYG95_03610 [Campylobacterales bacterium]|nr:hypothetical protein [Campylobacterales bacterium]
MKSKILVILLSINLLFLGCSSKSVNLDSTQASSEVRESSVGEKVVVGTLLAGAAALFLTTAAVVILLLVPKAQVEGR